MIYGLWQSAAGMAANLYRQNVAAHNLANIETTAFKKDLALLTERPVESQEDADAAVDANTFFDLLSGGTFVKPTLHNFEPGPANPTNQPLDVMIDGGGFFQVQTPDGVRYTRDGRFAINDQGRVVTVGGGHPVLDGDGSPITVTPGVQAHIDGQGQVRQGNTAVGTLGVVEFDNVSALRKTGGNLFVATDGAAGQSVGARLLPGVLEGANIDPIDGLLETIYASRSYQLNAAMLSMQDGTLGRLVNEVARF